MPIPLKAEAGLLLTFLIGEAMRSEQNWRFDLPVLPAPVPGAGGEFGEAWGRLSDIDI